MNIFEKSACFYHQLNILQPIDHMLEDSPFEHGAFLDILQRLLQPPGSLQTRLELCLQLWGISLFP